MIQSTLFQYEERIVTSEPKWLTGYDDEHLSMYRTDAEAFVEDLNRMPSGKGLWLRCLELDKSRKKDKMFENWDAEVWFQGGMGIRKLVNCEGEAMDIIEPHPYKWHYIDGKMVRPFVYEKIQDAWIEDDVVHVRADSGEYMGDVIDNSECRRCDVHPYEPERDLEHFAIRCYKNKVPREMMVWRRHYMYATDVMRPFCRNIIEEDAKKIDLMGNIPGAHVRNPEFDLICGCAEMTGLILRLKQDVPALDNISMYPIEKNCRSCLHHRSQNKKNSNMCDRTDNISCNNYIWDRKTKAKPQNQKQVNKNRT